MSIVLLLLASHSVVSASLDHMDCSMPGFPVLHCLPEFAQTHDHWVGDIIQPSHPLLPCFPPAFNLSQHQDLFQWVGSSHQVAKILELKHQYFLWIFRVDFDWFEILAVLATLKSLLQNHKLKASILQHSAFFMIQLSYPYMTIGKTIALPIWTSVSKMMSLLLNMLSRFVIDLLNMLSRFVIAFLPKSKHIHFNCVLLDKCNIIT